MTAAEGAAVQAAAPGLVTVVTRHEWEQRLQAAGVRSIVAAVAAFADPDDSQVAVTVQELVAVLGSDERQVRRRLDRLAASGWLRPTHEGFVLTCPRGRRR